MRLHFDGYSECHDFWLNADSPNIHPAGWFEETGHKLQPPKGKRLETSGLWMLLQMGLPLECWQSGGMESAGPLRTRELVVMSSSVLKQRGEEETVVFQREE